MITRRSLLQGFACVAVAGAVRPSFAADAAAIVTMSRPRGPGR
jgi:hypothetical protein